MEDRLKIPTIMSTPKIAVKRGERFRNLANFILSSNPQLSQELKQANIELKPTEYIGAGIYSLLNIVMLLVVVSLLLLYVAYRKDLINARLIIMVLFMDITVPIVYFFYYLNYPKLVAIRRSKDIEYSLPVFLREMLVKVRAGEPLFNSILEASQNLKGEISEVLTKIVERVEAGEELGVVMEAESKNIPSNLGRRVLETLSTAVRSGADLSSTIDALNSYIITHQQSEFQAYSRSLLPLSLAYMLICVILPSLGNTILVLLSSFAGINPEYILYIFPIIIIVFQFFFTSMIKQSRPALTI